MVEPTIEQRSAQPYVAIKRTVTMQTVADVLPPLIGDVASWLAERDIAWASAPFWKWDVIDMAGEMDVEVGVPVAAPVPAEGDVMSGVLPAGRYVTALHEGHPDGEIEAVRSLLAWADSQGLDFDVTPSARGDVWESRLAIYLTDPNVEPDLDKWQTQLAFRLRD